MGRWTSMSTSSVSRSDADGESEAEALGCPFGRVDTLSRSDLRETAYEIFFTSCRSSPGFGGRGSGTINYYPVTENHGGGDSSPTGVGPKGGTGMMVVNSRIKKALGLRARRSTPSMKTMSPVVAGGTGYGGGGPNSPGKVRRPMTSAEIMRQQMVVAEQSDGRLRKTLMRTLVGQMGRRAETIILPLELLRQLKPSEFNDAQEYHQWQRRQLRLLEAGLLLHPSIPLDRLNSAAARLREIIRSGEHRPIDTSKNSENMHGLCNSVVALAWRGPNGTQQEACHWIDGYPVNVHIYLALLRSIFDLRDETVVLDEVDELVELMKKTWSTLGINRPIHNVCFAWVLFQQYVATRGVEPDLMCAATAMVVEVGNDAKRPDRDVTYAKVLSSGLAAMHAWVEKRLLDYHENFNPATLENMDNIVSFALATSKIVATNPPTMPNMGEVEGDGGLEVTNPSENRVEYYIRSSMRNAFAKILEAGTAHDGTVLVEVSEEPGEILLQLAKDAEEIAQLEKETFSPVLKRFHPIPTAIAVVTLHYCFGVVLRQYLTKLTSLTNELVRVLQCAGKLEKVLVSMVVEDSAECEDGGKGIVREMLPYEVDSIVVSLMKTWIDERLRIAKECLSRAKETESWIPMSKSEPYANSAVDLVKIAKVTVDEFFEIPPVGARDDMVQGLADGLENIFQEYTAFVAACGNKQSYIPTLPPLTRCNQDSRFMKLWRKAAPRCHSGNGLLSRGRITEVAHADGHRPRPATSRGTQRLYIRLNTLHYLLAHLHALDKALSFFSRSHGPSPNANRRLTPGYYLDRSRSAAQAAVQQVSEVAAYRLIFLDSHHSLYDGLYVRSNVAGSRIRPALRILKQNLTLLVSILTDRAQPVAVKEVMKAAFEAFLMVLLAGGSGRAFLQADHEMILQDYRSLKRVFCTCGEGLVAEEVVEREAEVVDGIVELMGLPTERLIEDFSIAACEASGLGGGQTRLPMPPTTGRWSRSDPNTLLRVLCHRNQDTANNFLKKTFQLPKRR